MPFLPITVRLPTIQSQSGATYGCVVVSSEPASSSKYPINQMLSAFVFIIPSYGTCRTLLARAARLP